MVGRKPQEAITGLFGKNMAASMAGVAFMVQINFSIPSKNNQVLQSEEPIYNYSKPPRPIRKFKGKNCLPPTLTNKPVVCQYHKLFLFWEKNAKFFFTTSNSPIYYI